MYHAYTWLPVVSRFVHSAHRCTCCRVKQYPKWSRAVPVKIAHVGAQHNLRHMTYSTYFELRNAKCGAKSLLAGLVKCMLLRHVRGLS